MGGEARQTRGRAGERVVMASGVENLGDMQKVQKKM